MNGLLAAQSLKKLPFLKHFGKVKLRGLDFTQSVLKINQTGEIKWLT